MRWGGQDWGTEGRGFGNASPLSPSPVIPAVSDGGGGTKARANPKRKRDGKARNLLAGSGHYGFCRGNATPCHVIPS